MKYHLSKILLILGIIIPSFLFSACSEKTEYVHVSSKSKVWLGVKAKNIPQRRLDNLKLDYGLEVIKVYKDSPAEKAGLQVEDILLRVNESSVKDVDKLSEMIEDTEIDEKIKITYLRNGKELETEATISKRDRKVFVWNNKHENLEHFTSDKKHAWLGVSTDKLTDQLRQFFNVPEYLGVLVKEVVEDSPAEKSGLKAGDVIIQLGRKEIEDHNDLIRAVDRYDPGEEVEVKIIRDKKEQVLKVTLGEGKGRFRHFSLNPEKFEIYVPEMEIEIPEIDIEIPEIDVEELEELHEKMSEELEMHSDELNEELKELEKELKEIKIHTRHRKSVVI
jgi:membrane-associated protease RseP (regulator of RpoE activity)